jgi:hypothetical protein
MPPTRSGYLRCPDLPQGIIHLATILRLISAYFRLINLSYPVLEFMKANGNEGPRMFDI